MSIALAFLEPPCHSDGVVKSGKLWWQIDDRRERASVLSATCDRIARATQARITRAKRNLSLFENRKLTSLSPDAYYTMAELDGEEFDRQRINLARAIVNAAVAKVGGKQRPKVQFCVSAAADWATKRKAKRRERIVEAIQSQPQSSLQHADAWMVALMNLRDAAVCDMGARKWEIDWNTRRIVCRRVVPWELMVDPYEAKYGSPRNLFHEYGQDRFLLAEQFPAFEEDIMAAPAMSQEPHSDATEYLGDAQRLVRVREGWRLPTGDRHGRHSIAVGSVDLLDGEDGEWCRDFFPFEIITWQPWFLGIFGTGVVDEIAPICDEINASTERWAQAENRGSNVFVVAQKGTVAREQITSNVPFSLVEVELSATAMPQLVVPETQGQASILWNERLKALAYEIPGMTQQGATGQTANGVTAAVAMREENRIETERFSWQWRSYELMCTVGDARQINACLRELAEEDPDYAIRWAGGAYLQEARIGDFDFDDSQYVVQPYAVSGLVNTPTDRLNLASDLFDKGVLSREAFLRVIQYKNIDEELAGQSKQGELLEQMIGWWLDADLDLLEARDPDYLAEIYWPPEPFLDLPSAIVQVGRAYFDARLNRAPTPIISLFTDYLSACDKELQKQAQIQQQMQAPPAPAMPAAPAPTSPEVQNAA
jgi:hypothetical protein